MRQADSRVWMSALCKPAHSWAKRQKTCQFQFKKFVKLMDHKGIFLSESTDMIVITPSRQTFFFPETPNLNFGDF